MRIASARTSDGWPPHSRCSTISAPSRATRTTLQPRTRLTPSRRISFSTMRAASGSSRGMICGWLPSSDTCAPKRAKAWASSQPTGPAPMTARRGGGPRRPDEGLRGDAADVEAVAAQERALDQGDTAAQPGGAGGTDEARCARAQDDQVVASGRLGVGPVRRVDVAYQGLIVDVVW